MPVVYLALGSNVGDSKHHIKQAIKLLSKSVKDIKQAPLYASKAVGYTDQPDFVNTVIGGKTELEPFELLALIREVEQEVGRTATFRWGPREIDIDIILYGDMHMETEELTIPHASFRERDFVLKPLCNLDSELIDPISQLSVAALLAHIEAEQESVIQRID